MHDTRLSNNLSVYLKQAITKESKNAPEVSHATSIDDELKQSLELLKYKDPIALTTLIRRLKAEGRATRH